MVEKVKFINITGREEQLFAVTEELLPRYEIHLERATRELSGDREIKPLELENPYAEPLARIERITSPYGETDEAMKDLSKEQALFVLERAHIFFENTSKEIEELERDRDICLAAAAVLEPFTGLDCQMETLASFEYLECQFGRMPESTFQVAQEIIYGMQDILFVPAVVKDGMAYCVIFTTKDASERTHAVLSTMHFEAVDVPKTICGKPFTGTPKAGFAKAKAEAERIGMILDTRDEMMENHLKKSKALFTRQDLLGARKTLRAVKAAWEQRRFGASKGRDSFIFVGWINGGELGRFLEEAAGYGLTVIAEDDNEGILAVPPVKLRNAKIFAPFEFFTSMYGLPSYGETDPTPFVAITYTLLFGLMFADIGQGLVLFLAGLLLSRGRKPMKLGPVLKVIGLASVVFGALFGSVFGYEMAFAPYRPAEPDNIITTLLYAVVLGVALILISMTMNLVNAHKRKSWREALFSPNGVAGSVFYLMALGYALFMLLGAEVPGWYLPLMILPLIGMGFKEPLTEVLARKKPKVHGIGMFVFEAVIEMFEIALSFFANTVSYVRVGAFALSHACIMSVVWLLSRGAADSNNPLVIVFGNILVMALEGLIVGIQALRLEFYEMFSRFYEGGGRKFEKNTL
ncbi:MAG: hypothetical protein LBS19_10725 [Clostridiales bacterium]|jgi:V/A-type H+-transporting ATPase subunit I|nr:hypothetical protein [Clostridiales bacterium]